MNYYNDNDPKACAWLRELIADGHLPAGDVDERSILEIKADELRGYDQCHFFAGVGFWSLALQWAGLGTTPGIWTGSCPCQPFSCAGAGKGTADERHLWPVFRDLIVACRPAVVFGEQVASAAVIGKVGRGVKAPAVPVWLDGVRADVEAAGYSFGAAVMGAHSVGAPHIRQRLYWVADADGCDGERIRTQHIKHGLFEASRDDYGPAGIGKREEAHRPSDAIQRGIGGGNLRGLGADRQQVQEPQNRAHLADEPCDGYTDAVRPSDAELPDRRAEQQPGKPERRWSGLGGSGESGVASDVRYARSQGRHGQELPEHANERAAVPSMPWGDYRVHRYLDGKDRRIPTEPRLFPLADDRHPYHRGRVGLLRGAGQCNRAGARGGIHRGVEGNNERMT